MPRTIKTDAYVQTADGAIYRVSYVHDATQTADLRDPDRFDHTLTLPLAELRRVADPQEKRPPIEGLPPASERPVCALCGKPIAPLVRDTYAPPPHRWPQPRILRRTFVRWKLIADAFHSNDCAVRFARLAYRAGYRVKKTQEAS